VTSPECECVGGPAFGGYFIPGYLDVRVSGVQDANGAPFIGITSPNGTDVKVAPLREQSTGLEAATVAFNGFPANGSWVIKLLDASGNLSTQTATRIRIQFGLISCNQVLPTPDCVGNSFGGQEWVAENLALAGTTLSSSPTLLHFDVEASSACCVAAPPDGFVLLVLLLSGGGSLNAAGLTPAPDAIAFNLRPRNIQNPPVPTRVPTFDVDAFAGARAAGLWTLNTSTDATAVIQSTGSGVNIPRLELAVEPCS